MKYKMALACNKFEQVFVDQLKRTSELVSILSGNCCTKFTIEIDVHQNKAILWMSQPEIGGKILFEGQDISGMNDDNQIESVRNTLATVSSFLSKFNGSLAEIRKSCLTNYTQKEWDIIYESSNENSVIVSECTISEYESVDYTIYPNDIITPASCYSFAISCGLSKDIVDKAFGTNNSKKEHIKIGNNKEDEDAIEAAIRNIQKEVTNIETIKGTYNDNRVMIPHPTNAKGLRVRQFDKEKDFTVIDTIKALLKFDLDLPVNIVYFAPAIGSYDMHLNKISKSFLYGYDKETAVGLYVDEK